jgi:hypothetical protein
MAQRIIRDAQHEKARLDEMARRKEARLIARAEGRTRWIPIERKPPLESRLEDARRRHDEREAKECEAALRKLEELFPQEVEDANEGRC